MTDSGGYIPIAKCLEAYGLTTHKLQVSHTARPPMYLFKHPARTVSSSIYHNPRENCIRFSPDMAQVLASTQRPTQAGSDCSSSPSYCAIRPRRSQHVRPPRDVGPASNPDAVICLLDESESPSLSYLVDQLRQVCSELRWIRRCLLGVHFGCETTVPRRSLRARFLYRNHDPE